MDSGRVDSRDVDNNECSKKFNFVNYVDRSYYKNLMVLHEKLKGNNIKYNSMINYEYLFDTNVANGVSDYMCSQ